MVEERIYCRKEIVEGFLLQKYHCEKGKFKIISGEELSLRGGNFGNILLRKGMTDKPK